MITSKDPQDDEFIDEFIEEVPQLQNASDSSDDASIAEQHYRSILAICLCTFTHSWLLVSVFPYSAFMVIFLVPGTNEETAGTYAGVLAASFMMGRAITAYAWGATSDIYGRRIVFFLSLALSSLFCVLFGMATSFKGALLWRFLMGASNGIAGISKTVVTETAQGNERLETKGMSLSMGMWAWGFLLSPGISGFLSDPLRQYPNLALPTLLENLLQAHPFLLPNLVSVLLCVLDFVAVMWLVPETLPNPRQSRYILSDACAYCHQIYQRILHVCLPIHNPQRNNESVLDSDDEEEEIESLLPPITSDIELSPRRAHNHNSTTTNTTTKPTTTIRTLWSKKDTRNHLIVFWIFSFVGIAIDEAFPLFCISKEGGLGLDEAKIGSLLSATGVLFAILQYKAYDWVVTTFGLHKSIWMGALLSAPLVVLVPVSMLLNRHPTHEVTNPQSLTWSAFLFLAVLLGFIRIFGLVFFSSITIATNHTVAAEHRGTMNGLSMLGGSIAKGLGPIAAGMFTTAALSKSPRMGSVLVFGTIGVCSGLTVWIAKYLLSEPTKDYSTNDGTSPSNLNQNQRLSFQEATVRRRSVTTD